MTSPLGPQAAYQRFLGEGRFMLQYSPSANRYVLFPRVAVPGTGETDLEWVEARGTGTVYAATVTRARSGDFNVVIVELDEGPRLMSRVDGILEVAIGTRVGARIAEIDGEPAVVFDVIGDPV
ncbi:MAG: nucleic acid-binding protein [Hyphomicrobiales bacterium]|nr:MAG: nucleic acid-binding protein [Hyphomicrobiales bacterium]